MIFKHFTYTLKGFKRKFKDITKYICYTVNVVDTDILYYKSKIQGKFVNSFSFHHFFFNFITELPL